MYDPVNRSGSGSFEMDDNNDVPPLALPALNGQTSTLYLDTPMAPLVLGESEYTSSNKWFRKSVAIMTFLSIFALAVICSTLMDALSASSSNDRVAMTSQTAFMTSISIDGIQETLNEYTKTSRLAGSYGDEEMAIYLQKKALAFGIKEEMITRREMEMPLGRPGGLSLTCEDDAYEFTLKEELSVGISTGHRNNTTPFHMNAQSGQVKGRMVYANYGRRQDFERLLTEKIHVQDTIVLVRNGKISLGAKIQNALFYQAAGVLTYSDPKDISSTKQSDQVWSHLVQSESAALAPPKAHNAEDSNLEQGTLPSLPISALNAKEIFQRMKKSSTALPQDWNGGLDVVYAFTSDVDFSLKNSISVANRPVTNVIITIPGTHEPHRYVILGSRRDSATGGASSGSSVAIFTELLRGIGGLLNNGWSPRRTLILASWGAEEYQQSGAAAWIEENLSQLISGAIVYLEIHPILGSGAFRCATSPTVRNVTINSAKLVQRPILEEDESTAIQDVLPDFEDIIVDKSDTISVYDIWLNQTDSANGPKFETPGQYPWRLSPFLSGLGIPYISFYFDGNAAHHSIYDTLDDMITNGDPHLLYHKTISQIWGNTLLDLVECIVYRYDFNLLSNDLTQAWKGIQKTYTASLNSNITTLLRNDVSTHLEMFQQVVQDIKVENRAILTDLNDLLGGDIDVEKEQRVSDLNNRFLATHRSFVDMTLYGTRDWWRHELFSPVPELNFEVRFLGRIESAVLLGNSSDIAESLRRTSRVLDQAHKSLSSDLP